MTEHVEQNTNRSNLTLWILIMAFAVPIIGAYAYFFFVEDHSLGNHGELLQPLIQIEDLKLTDDKGIPKKKEELVRGWKMLLIAGKDCDAVCQQSIFNMRQINIALGKNTKRFTHMIIHHEAMSPQFEELIQKQHENALHSYSTIENLSEAFTGSKDIITPGSIYIMDPLGFIMMRFDHGLSPKLILKDLNRLLKISRIG